MSGPARRAHDRRQAIVRGCLRKFVWWENQIDPTLVFGIPMGGWRMPDGKFGENNQMEPDIRIRNDPEIMTGGRDQQLEAAVTELLSHK